MSGKVPLFQCTMCDCFFPDVVLTIERAKEHVKIRKKKQRSKRNLFKSRLAVHDDSKRTCFKGVFTSEYHFRRHTLED